MPKSLKPLFVVEVTSLRGLSGCAVACGIGELFCIVHILFENFSARIDHTSHVHNVINQIEYH